MSRIVTVASHEGGVGKTTAVLNLGHAPAGTGGVLHGLLCASDGLVGVTAARALSVRGLPSLLQAFELARRTNAALAFDGLLLAGYDVLQQPESVLEAQLMKELPPGALFSTVIPWVPAVEVASQRCVPAALVPGAQRVAAASAQLASGWSARQPGGSRRGEPDVFGLF